MQIAPKTTILLVDDHKIMCEGLRALLARERGLEVVGEASDGRTAIKLARKLKPDVVVMDVGMPDLSGIDATKQILAKVPGAKVLGLSMHSERQFVLGMLRAGASGYVLKDCAIKELACAVRQVAAGQTYLSPKIADIVVEDYVRRVQRGEPSAESILTDREREVVQLLAQGESTRQTASRLNVSIKTIETHRRHIMDKLGIHSVAELTKYAIREGLTSLEP